MSDNKMEAWARVAVESGRVTAVRLDEPTKEQRRHSLAIFNEEWRAVPVVGPDGISVAAAPQHPSACSLAEVKGIVEEVRETRKNRVTNYGNGYVDACDVILARLSALKPNGGGDDAKRTILKSFRSTWPEGSSAHSACNRMLDEMGTKDTDRMDWIIENCATKKDGDGFMLAVFVPHDSESVRDAIDAAIKQSTGTGVEG